MNNDNLIPTEEQSGLFDDNVQYTEASQGQRFLNWLIDNLFMRFVLSYATGYVAGYILLYVAPEFLGQIAMEEMTGTKSWRFIVLAFILGYINYLIYYIFCEAAFNGYTLGKLLTGTKAIRNDGGKLTLRDASLRSVSRIVPLEVFSGLGDRPWHDSWTNTTVVKAR